MCQNFRLVKENPDGSKWIELDGKPFLAITGEQSDEWQRNVNDLRRFKEVAEKQDLLLAEKDKQLVTAEELRKTEAEKAGLQKQIADSLRADVTRFQSLFMSERELRREASTFVPHGNKTKFDKFLALFDSKAMQFAIKGAIPIWQTWRCQ